MSFTRIFLGTRCLQQCGVQVLFGQMVHEAPFFSPSLACQIMLTLVQTSFSTAQETEMLELCGWSARQTTPKLSNNQYHYGKKS